MSCKQTKSYKIHEYLVQEWYNELATTPKTYKEPILEEYTVDLIKLCCDSLKLDNHVFMMSAEVLELYIIAKNNKKVIIDDAVLSVICTIFICSKHVGEQAELRVCHIKSFLKKITAKDYEDKAIRKCEIDVLQTLNCQLPLKSTIDDLDTLYVYYVLQHLKLKSDIRNLCVELLNVVTISWFRIFYCLKRTYSKNEECREVFEKLVINKCFVPCSVIVCALHMTNSCHSLNFEQVYLDLEQLTQIHSDHLVFLAAEIYDIAYKKTKYKVDN